MTSTAVFVIQRPDTPLPWINYLGRGLLRAASPTRAAGIPSTGTPACAGSHATATTAHPFGPTDVTSTSATMAHWPGRPRSWSPTGGRAARRSIPTVPPRARIHHDLIEPVRHPLPDRSRSAPCETLEIWRVIHPQRPDVAGELFAVLGGASSPVGAWRTPRASSATCRSAKPRGGRRRVPHVRIPRTPEPLCLFRLLRRWRVSITQRESFLGPVVAGTSPAAVEAGGLQLILRLAAER